MTSAQTATTPARAEIAAEWVERVSLKPWTQNPRKNEHAIAKVMASIKRFGFGSPILARRANNEVIAGHTRLLAAEALGIDRVPVRFLDLDPADAHLLALADNKIGEVAEWDDAKLAEILSGYGLSDADLAGWDSKELDKLSASFDEAPADDDSAKAAVGYVVLVDCESEEHQLSVIDQLLGLGLKCRALT